MRRSDELRLRLDALAAFHAAVGELLQITERDGDDYWAGSGARPRTGLDRQWSERKAIVDRLAPKAARAFEDAGIVISWKPPGTWNTYPINPGTEWSTILSRSPRFSASDLEACIHQGQGALEDQIENPVRDHRGLVIVAGWRHWPAVAKWVAGVIGPVLVAGLIYLLGWR